MVTDARRLNAWRRWGYRALPGELFSYVLHMRPAEWPIMAGHTILGYALAVGLKGAVSGEQFAPALLGLTVWVIFLNGGTLAINSVFDKDEGDIGYLIAPPPLPRHLLAFSVALLAGGQLLAFALPLAFRLDYALILGMRASLAVAVGCTLVAFALFGLAAWRLAPGATAALLVVPLALWLGTLGPWYAGQARWTAADHQRGMYRALGAWAVTDITILLVFAR